MKKRHFTLHPHRFSLLLCVLGLMILAYLANVGRSLLALASFQSFSAITAEQEGKSLTPDSHQRALSTAQRALRLNRNDPALYSALGTYLHRYSYEPSSAATDQERDRIVAEAKSQLKAAVMLKPGDPWNYYELGRLAANQETCNEQKCPAKRYFSAALNASPSNVFLRATIAAWSYHYEPETSRQMIRELLPQDPTLTMFVLDILWPSIKDSHTLRSFLPEQPDIFFEFAHFLYEQRLDEKSDSELKGLQQSAINAECDVPDAISMIPNERGPELLELGHDDGSAEWRSYLASDEARIKKIICLPENLDEYDEGSLKIYMSSGFPGEFTAYFSIDEFLIQKIESTSRYELGWYEIPFDISLLRGRRRIAVYVRVSHASSAGNYLQIMGDRDTPNARSVFNFENTEDLSFDRGIQQGEYMIRLVLKKPVFSLS